MIKLIIAIDGTVGSGKSSTALALAKNYGFKLVDSGAMYRALGVIAKNNNIDFNNEKSLSLLAKSLNFDFVLSDKENKIYVNGIDFTKNVSSYEAGLLASKVAILPDVRKVLVSKQRLIAENESTIMTGRDIGTVVFSDAHLKFYFDANFEERARRRFLEYKNKNINIDYDDILKQIIERDKRDTERDASPLKPADDAIIINTTNLSFEQQLEKLTHIIDHYIKGFTGKKPKMRPIYKLGYYFIYPVLLLVYGLRVYGKHNIPYHYPLIVASNHKSYLDPPVVGLALGKEVYFIAKKELFNIPVLSFFIREFNAIPVKRGSLNLDLMQKVSELIKNKQSVIIFPEGTRILKPELGEVLDGIGILTLKFAKDAYILPVYIDGNFKTSKAILRAPPITVYIGKPLSPFIWRDWEHNRENYSKIAKIVFDKIFYLKSNIRR